MKGMDATRRAEIAPGGRTSQPAPPSAERIALGVALQSRADEVGHLVDDQFAVSLRGEAFAGARLATELIGRWLATDQVATAEEEQSLSRKGRHAIIGEADLADVAKSYFTWRDACMRALTEEGVRLGVSDELLKLALRVVRFSCDGSLVRIVREFDETRRTLQRRLREEQAALAHRALHDELTGLPNRTLLTDRLGQSARGAERRDTRAMLLFLDLDNFKAINDRFGHPAGDSLLVAVASRLEELVRAHDTVARLGGDEFVILADELTEPETAARSLAQRIHEAMREPVTVGERELLTSVSIGIATVPPDADPETCLAQADVAMYEAKRGGPARVEEYDEAIGRAHRRRSQLADALRVAHGLGQFAIHYQPLFRLGGELVGMEALLRWVHPELGSVAPVEFIPLLEQSREIVPIGRWVLEESTHQCRQWQEQGRPALTMSVNVSAPQLQDPDFCDDVQSALLHSGLAPECLSLEVTESVLVADAGRIGAAMRQLRGLGVHLALDGFGTGLSSLLHLNGLPIERLKIDRSFVTGLGASSEGPSILSTVVDLAHKLGLSVVALGVETEAELHAVGAIGCDEVQGFLLGRPGPAGAHAVADPGAVLLRS